MFWFTFRQADRLYLIGLFMEMSINKWKHFAKRENPNIINKYPPQKTKNKKNTQQKQQQTNKKLWSLRLWQILKHGYVQHCEQTHLNRSVCELYAAVFKRQNWKKDRERDLIQAVKHTGLSLCGPNIYSHYKLTASSFTSKLRLCWVFVCTLVLLLQT